MSRKDYEMIAAAIKAEAMDCYADELGVLGGLAERLCILFKADNSNFDSDRFMRACGV